MNDDVKHSTASGPGTGIKAVLFEAALVALAGAVFAFVANAVSPRGLALAKNYFPGGTNGTVSASLPALPPRGAGSTNPVSAAELVAARLQEKGLQGIDRERAARLYHDPRLLQGLVVFIDARDEAHYREGHVPGAYEFDPYRAEAYLAAVLPVCQAAEEIVVYCNGGDCEDSQFAALALRDAGIANQKLFVYTGGIAEWAANGLPVEMGGRNSGNLRNADK